jgi:hypothetical protein
VCAGLRRALCCIAFRSPRAARQSALSFPGNAMRLALGATIKEIISGMPDVSQCAFDSWRIPKREAEEGTEGKARPAQYWSCSSPCKLICMSKRLRVSVFVTPTPCWCDAKQPSMRRSQQYRNSAYQGVSLSCGRVSSMAGTLSSPLSMHVALCVLHAFIRLSPSPAPVVLDAAAAIHRRWNSGGDRNCSQRHSDGRL